jgi:hypothetical protein
MLEARLDRIPNYLKASTPRGLRLSMLKNNVKHATQFVYHSIQFVDGYWYAWYYVQTNLEEISNDTNGAG